ncbi:HAD-IIB family hydrolase [Enterococcus sp. CWB-B31]|uniref:HAD-IIB family hydrolase n=1 Tax=Enterococcus sp. CWB-B31 TaxID=2885159 RepID=UPI001E47E2EA|nr:HAD-IIB family hydrolase [Enterococcus sp. CWB-B31]MCB5955450.1 Cof-type HAD-IIB family hydrolase [Enterococcus sp. CWB-B31]
MDQFKKIKLLVCDMDGTLTYEESDNTAYTPSKKGLPERNHQSISEFIEAGGLFCVATGRLLEDVRSVFGDELFSKSYKIVQNGSFAMDRESNIAAEDFFSEEQSKRIYAKLRSLNLPFSCSTLNQHTYESHVSDELMEQAFGNVVEKMEITKKFAHPENPANICVVRENVNDLRKDMERLHRVLADEEVNYQITSPYTIDINPKSVNKGAAVSSLIEQFGIKATEVAVVGDSYNDISMFRCFPNSYAMAHAEEGVKKYANHQISMVAEVFTEGCSIE